MQSIISLILSLVAILVSVVNLFFVWRANRKWICIRFDSCVERDFIDPKKQIVVSYQITNKSRQPISLTRIQLIIGTAVYDCDSCKRMMEEYVRKINYDVVTRETTFNDILPVNLGPLSAHSGYLSFRVPQDILLTWDKSLNLRICTNRGKVIQKSFVLCEEKIFH